MKFATYNIFAEIKTKTEVVTKQIRVRNVPSDLVAALFAGQTIYGTQLELDADYMKVKGYTRKSNVGGSVEEAVNFNEKPEQLYEIVYDRRYHGKDSSHDKIDCLYQIPASNEVEAAFILGTIFGNKDKYSLKIKDIYPVNKLSNKNFG